MAIDLTNPDLTDTDALAIAKGIVSFMRDGDSEFLDLGFVPSFDLSQDITEKDYNSAREGITTVALTVTTKQKTTVDLVLNSIVPETVALFSLGDVGEVDSDGGVTVSSLTNTQIVGIMKVDGTNQVGLKKNWIGRVSLRPNGKLSMLTDGDDWNGIPLQATVIFTELYGAGQFYFPAPS